MMNDAQLYSRIAARAEAFGLSTDDSGRLAHVVMYEVRKKDGEATQDPADGLTVGLLSTPELPGPPTLYAERWRYQVGLGVTRIYLGQTEGDVFRVTGSFAIDTDQVLQLAIGILTTIQDLRGVGHDKKEETL